MTPIEDAVCVSTTDTAKAAARRLQSNDFDHAPVTEAGQVVGIFHASKTGERGQRVVEVMDRLVPDNTVDADAPLEDLPRWLCECQFQIVLARKRVVGLVNAADLNKQAVRSLLFLHIADAERKLAALIHRAYEQDDDWLCLLSEKTRNKIEEAHRQTQKGDVDIRLLESACFIDLLTVVSKRPIHDRIAPLLNWDLAKHKGGINELRTAACHPVKAVLRSVAELPKLVERFERVHELISAANKLLCNGNSYDRT